MKYSESFKEWKCTLGMIATVAILVSFIMKHAIDKNMERDGYCFDKGKYLLDIYTEQELIDGAIESILDSIYSVLVLPEDITFNFRDREYLSVEDFKSLNPNCCKLIYGAIPDGLQENVFLNVELSYWIYLSDSHQYRKVTSYVAYSSCGIRLGKN
ncbi:hypothetical protein [Frederiksenia canicola]